MKIEILYEFLVMGLTLLRQFCTSPVVPVVGTPIFGGFSRSPNFVRIEYSISKSNSHVGEMYTAVDYAPLCEETWSLILADTTCSQHILPKFLGKVRASMPGLETPDS